MADRVGNLAIIISGDAKQLMQVMSGVEAHVAASQARMDAKMRKSAGGGALGGSASYLGGAAKAFAAANFTSSLMFSEILRSCSCLMIPSSLV